VSQAGSASLYLLLSQSICISHTAEVLGKPCGLYRNFISRQAYHDPVMDESGHPGARHLAFGHLFLKSWACSVHTK
jgi:hypothetical protein